MSWTNVGTVRMDRFNCSLVIERNYLIERSLEEYRYVSYADHLNSLQLVQDKFLHLLPSIFR